MAPLILEFLISFSDVAKSSWGLRNILGKTLQVVL